MTREEIIDLKLEMNSVYGKRSEKMIMTREEIVDKLEIWLQQARANAAITHPAFPSFVNAMEDRRYGTEETVSAWQYFREGWDSHDDLVEQTQDQKQTSISYDISSAYPSPKRDDT